MAYSDTQNFLTDLLTRYDPNLDLTEGSRAQTEIIEPILQRIGGDPFDEDFETFIRTRIAQVRPDLAIAETDELTDLLIDPMRILIEPISREIQLIKLRISLQNVNSLADEEVDALLGNFFEARKAGGYALGTVRAYFASPQSVSATLIHVAQSRSGLRFTVPRPQQITADQMVLNIEGSEYYFDINYTAELRGDEYNVEKGEISSIANLPQATRVTNLRRFSDGVPRETSEDYVARVQQGSSDKTLTTSPGITSVLTESFPALQQVYEIGMGDPEMKRDIIKGGSLGAIPRDDSLGAYYGHGAPVDDLDADSTTPILSAPGGNFVTRVGAAGQVPDGWYVSLVYTSGSLVVVDARVTRVISETRLQSEHEIPIGVSDVVWMLRKRQLTISDIPGGITLPDTPAGTLELPSDQVHIGGKTDIFVSGAVDQASAQIVGLTDEEPLARGYNAQTQGGGASADIVLLPDINTDLFARVLPGMSLVLSEGSDLGAYRITEKIAPTSVRVDTVLTGSQPNLTWKIVDEIDLNLIEPKDVLLEGSDLILSAGSPVVIAAGGFNFAGAGIRPDDILFIDDELYGGDFTITAATASSMSIDPPAPRALSGVHYVVSRRSEGVLRPVLRISGLELLDSAGAPNGTVIPYRDPVLCLSRGFQNEGQGYLYDGPAFLGLISSGFTTYPAVSSQTISWSSYDPAAPYGPAEASGTVALSGVSSMANLVSQINASSAFTAAGIRAVALTYAGKNYLGFTSTRLVKVTGGSALAGLGWTVGMSNAQVRGNTSLSDVKVRRGDLVECVAGNNAGVGARVITDPSANTVSVGTGPLGPPGTNALYDNAPLSPDAGGRVRIARPSVGSVRTFFLDPTSADFSYRTTRFSATVNGQEIVYTPDPENTRTLIPPPPTTEALSTGALSGGSSGYLQDYGIDFLNIGVQQGDLLDIRFRPITGTATFDDVTPINVSGLTLIVQLDTDPFIQVSFPYAMTAPALVEYINTQVGADIASHPGPLQFEANRRIEFISTSTALNVLGLSTLNNEHPAQGTYVVQSVTSARLYASPSTPFPAGAWSATYYRVRRYLQRVSSTEMNLQLDASGLYYFDVEAVSLLPGDAYNIGTDLALEATGYRADGYRLRANRPELSFSRAEDLRAELSRSLLLVGASDNPAEYVQLNLQNVQVSYERSALADDIQSFCSSRYRRVVCEDILVRHLLPHYVSLNWRYNGGSSEPDMLRAISEFLAKIEGGGELEVGALVDVLRGKQASSVFAVDTTTPSGRTAPQLLVVSHGEDRSIRASLVKDIVETVRMCTYLPDNIVLKRLSSSGVR